MWVSRQRRRWKGRRRRSHPCLPAPAKTRLSAESRTPGCVPCVCVPCVSIRKMSISSSRGQGHRAGELPPPWYNAVRTTYNTTREGWGPTTDLSRGDTWRLGIRHRPIMWRHVDPMYPSSTYHAAIRGAQVTTTDSSGQSRLASARPQYRVTRRRAS